MGKQSTFAGLAWKGKGKVTRRERFLAEMDSVIPWSRLLALIEPHYPKGEGGRPAVATRSRDRPGGLELDGGAAGRRRAVRPGTRSE